MDLLKETRRGTPFPNEKSHRILLTKNGQGPCFELQGKEEGSSHFAKPKRLVPTSPHPLTANLLLAALPFEKDLNTGAGLGQAALQLFCNLGHQGCRCATPGLKHTRAQLGHQMFSWPELSHDVFSGQSPVSQA